MRYYDRLDNTVNFLLGVPVRDGMTREEVENLIQQGRQTNTLLGVFGLETFYISNYVFFRGTCGGLDNKGLSLDKIIFEG